MYQANIPVYFNSKFAQIIFIFQDSNDLFSFSKYKFGFYLIYEFFTNNGEHLHYKKHFLCIFLFLILSGFKLGVLENVNITKFLKQFNFFKLQYFESWRCLILQLTRQS